MGEMIPDQIVESVESSRRTVIVLSENYVKSVWTKMEFNVAHTQALNDSIQVIKDDHHLNHFQLWFLKNLYRKIKCINAHFYADLLYMT